MDFRLDPKAEIQEQWSPEGYSWYGDELISDRPKQRASPHVLPAGREASTELNGINRRHRPSRYSQSEQLEILDNHPFFTGVCPRCRYKFDEDSLLIHHDCPNCNWIDNSV